MKLPSWQVIATVHWGSAVPKGRPGDFARYTLGYDVDVARGVVYQREPDCLQKNFTHVLAESGATVVLGMHPHVPQGFEKYRTQNGRSALIVYSLGNFISKGGFEETLPSPSFLGRGYNSETSLLYRRTAPFAYFKLRFDKDKGWAEASCMSYLPLTRRLVTRNRKRKGKQENIPWEVYTEVADQTSKEFSFLTSVFGQLDPRGGTFPSAKWVSNGKGQLQCHSLTALSTTKVDDSVQPPWYYTNPKSGKKLETAHLQCMKCEKHLGSSTANGMSNKKKVDQEAVESG
jgi:hypothetical protein